MTDEIKNTLAVIPHQPGCYQFLDEKGTVIYVGKAKNLKRRVSSYFNKVQEHPKTRILVSKIQKIKYIVALKCNNGLNHTCFRPLLHFANSDYILSFFEANSFFNC